MILADGAWTGTGWAGSALIDVSVKLMDAGLRVGFGAFIFRNLHVTDLASHDGIPRSAQAVAFICEAVMLVARYRPRSVFGFAPDRLPLGASFSWLGAASSGDPVRRFTFAAGGFSTGFGPPRARGHCRFLRLLLTGAAALPSRFRSKRAVSRLLPLDPFGPQPSQRSDVRLHGARLPRHPLRRVLRLRPAGGVSSAASARAVQLR